MLNSADLSTIRRRASWSTGSREFLRSVAKTRRTNGLRRIRFSNGLWGVGIRDRDDDYLILWDGQDLPETATVVYVGVLPQR